MSTLRNDLLASLKAMDAAKIARPFSSRMDEAEIDEVLAAGVRDNGIGMVGPAAVTRGAGRGESCSSESEASAAHPANGLAAGADRPAGRVVRVAPEALEQQRIPKAAHEMAKGYFRNLRDQTSKDPKRGDKP